MKYDIKFSEVSKESLSPYYQINKKNGYALIALCFNFFQSSRLFVHNDGFLHELFSDVQCMLNSCSYDPIIFSHPSLLHVPKYPFFYLYAICYFHI